MNAISSARHLRTLGLLTLAASVALLSGCLIGSHSSSRVEGSYVGSQTLDAIKPGQTRKDYILATLGEPSSRGRLDDGSEIWRYCYTRHKDYNGHVFLIFAAHNTDDVVRTTFVHLDKEGVVERVWQESSDMGK